MINNKPLQAYHVYDSQSEHHEIVFAESRGKAIQKSEGRQWNDYIEMIARRKKQYDQYAEKGYVPMMVHVLWI